MKIGVLALQGDFSKHAEVLADLGAHVHAVRMPSDLGGIDAIVCPGGESTTMSLLLEASGLGDALAALLRDGLPAMGTCAGMILLGAEVVGGRAGQRCFQAIDISVRRNAFGTQADSFECDLEVAGLSAPPVRAVFIRAPVVSRVGPEVEILASLPAGPVLCRQGSVLVSAFHPECSGETRLHQLFLDGLA